MPPGLAALPEPWNLSDPYASSVAIKSALGDDAQRFAASAALESCLICLTEDHERFGDEPGVRLPEQFFEAWPFVSRGFAARMPHFADVSYANVRQWLAEDIDPSVLFGEHWEAPPPEIVEEVGRFWVRGAVGLLTMDLLRWLRGSYRDDPAAPGKARTLALLKAAAPRLPWRIGQRAVSVVWDLSKPGGRDFLAMMANRPDAPRRTRDEAARLLTYAEESPGTRGRDADRG